MRFNISKPADFTTRIKWGFLFLPRSINGDFRWLCFAKWREVFRVGGYDGWGEGWYGDKWL